MAKNPVLDSVEQCGYCHLHQSVKGDGLITNIGLRLPEQEKAMLGTTKTAFSHAPILHQSCTKNGANSM